MTVPDVEAPLVDGRVVPSAAASKLLLESHAVDARAFLLADDGQARAALPLISGSVSCDPASMVRRSATLTVMAAWPDTSTSRLTPYGSRVLVQRGIRVALDELEWMTLMTGPIWETGQDDDAAGPGQMSLPLKDEMAVVAADRFDENTATDTSLTVLEQLTRIVRRTHPAAQIIDLSGPLGQGTVGKLDMQKDPAGGIAKIAAAAGLEMFCGRGWKQFVLRPVPSLDDPPRWSVSDGDGGNLISRTRKRTREKVYNRVRATGDTSPSTGTDTAATPPVSGVAEITDASDPLWVGGPLGRITRFFSSPLITTPEQAVAAANGLLAKLRGGNLEVDFTTLVNPALDGGDVIVADVSDNRSVHIVDAVTVPLSHADTQAVPTRGIDLPDETAA